MEGRRERFSECVREGGTKRERLKERGKQELHCV